MKRLSGLLAAPLAVVAAVALGACGSPQAAAGTSGGRLDVVTAFYPLQFAAEQIGGDHVNVTSLTRPGAEPHDIELTPRDVASVSTAKLVIYEKGLQAAVDQAVGDEGASHALDVAPAADLNLRFQEAVGASDHVSTGDNAPGTTDPHFWLDPQRYAHVAQTIADRLSSIDPGHEADYARNAKAFVGRLIALTREFKTGLAHCQRTDIVTSHAAFGYLAERFGLSQVAIDGLSPDADPLPSKLVAVANYAKAHGVTTIFAETLVSPAIANTVAQTAGAHMATLDPLEGLTSKSAGKDYFQVMRSNLQALRAGLGCS